MAYFDDMFNMNSSMEQLPVIEGDQYYPDNGGVATIVAEAHADHLEIIKAIHAADMAELRATTEGYDSYDLERLQEASGENIFTKIKNAIKKFFGKIGAFFKGIYEKIFVYNKNNKSFYNTYASKVKDVAAGTTVTVNGFEYTHIDRYAEICGSVADKSGAITAGLSKRVESFIDKAKTDYDNASNATDEKPYDANAVDYGKGVSSDVIKSGIIRSLLGVTNFDEKATISDVVNGMMRTDQTRKSIKYDAQTVLSELKIISEIDVGKIKSAEKKTTKDFGKIMNTVSKAEKKYNSLPSDNKAKSSIVAACNKLSKDVVTIKSAVLTIISALISVVVDYSSQVKSATTKLLAEAKKAKNNSK